MTDLRSRLARLGYQVTTASEIVAPGDRTPEGDGTRPSPRTSPMGRGRATPFPIDLVVDGSRMETPFGECFVVEQACAPGHPHGAHRLDEALQVDPQALSWLGRRGELDGLDLCRCVFLDVETTGLAGGTGTYAFLVGLAHFEGSRFVVRQLFMEDFDAEEAMLQVLTEAVERFQGVVTFNGKAFDLPLLDTRFSIARRAFPLRGILHLDLLFPSRRLWRERLESCALSNLEIRVLGVEREGDIPGWLIPGIYFDYLRDRDARPLARVFEHNRLDLLSMATLAARLARLYADPLDPELVDARDLHALGAAFEDLGLSERAAISYERSVALAADGEMRGRSMARLAGLYKRLRQRDDAVALWRRLAASSSLHATYACVELAKHYEHVARAYAEAESVTLQALVGLELRAARGEPWRAGQERRELEHRLVRLRRKKMRSEGSEAV